MVPEINKSVYIQAYKHNGSLHRTWDQGFVLEADEDHFVIVTNKTWVVEQDGRRWYTREPAVCYFYTKRWFNVIAMIRNDGIYYYCNLSSPVLYDGEAVKYIDYDIDYKIYSNGAVITMDLDEYNLHSRMMHYPPEIDIIIKAEMAKIMEQYKKNLPPFNTDYVEVHFHQYINTLTNNSQL